LRKVLIILVVLGIFGAPAGAADDCEELGQIDAMLGEIQNQCTTYRLTNAGHKARIDMAAKGRLFDDPACAEKGVTAMNRLLDQTFPNIKRIAKSGDRAAFNREYCKAIAAYLQAHVTPDLVEEVP